MATTTISVGDAVTWTMRSTPHTVTATPCGTGDVFDSGIANAITLGFVFTHTFNTPGTCAYHCTIHPAVMQGQVQVNVL
jgi:plastocyanin